MVWCEEGGGVEEGRTGDDREREESEINLGRLNIMENATQIRGKK